MRSFKLYVIFIYFQILTSAKHFKMRVTAMLTVPTPRAHMNAVARLGTRETTGNAPVSKLFLGANALQSEMRFSKIDNIC